MESSDKLKKKIITALKLNGFTIRSELGALIVKTFEDENVDFSENFDYYIRTMCNYLEKYIDPNKCIEKKNIEGAVELCIQMGLEDQETRMSVISAFDCPRMYYDITRKHYYLNKSIKPSMVPDEKARTEMFVQRYRNVLQRAERVYKERNIENYLTGDNQYHVLTVDAVLTRNNTLLTRSYVLGSLNLAGNGKCYIEDPTGMMELNLKHVKYESGFFSENVFVLVNGFYSEKVLQVSVMKLPPTEPSEISRVMFKHINYFGGTSEHLLRLSDRLANYMRENQSETIVFLSDLWFDKEIVFEKLEKMFAGYEETPPVAFVFLGNFISFECNTANWNNVLSKAFTRLAKIIKSYPRVIKTSTFIFVPGMQDPTMPDILPRMGLPRLVAKDFEKICKNTIFTTNPCRIQYCTREIVVYRNDVVGKFLRDCLYKPPKEKSAEYVVETILSQAHLAPFSLNCQPAFWEYDHALHLYPLPNLVIVGDQYKAYSGEADECKIVNPGSFTENGFIFKSYKPYEDVIEDCSL